MIDKAIKFATDAHKGQTNFSKMPYILHPLGVMHIINLELRPYCPEYALEAILVVAALHDVVEDTEITLDQIEENFGMFVMGAVDSVTRREGESYESYIQRAKTHPIGRIVKWADLLYNLALGKVLPLPGEKGERLRQRYLKALEEVALNRLPLAA